MTEPVELPNRAKLGEIFGRVAKTQEGFADALTRHSGVNVSQQVVNNWLKREQVPASWVRYVVQAGAGKIAADEVRPDIFGLV